MASALFEIDPGTAVYGAPGEAQDVSAAGAVINCRVVDIAGIIPPYNWECFGTHSDSAAKLVPTLTGSPSGQIAQFTVPAGAGQAYGIRLIVNGGPSVTGDANTEARSAVFVLDANSRRLLFVGETFEENSTHGFMQRLNEFIADIP